MVKVMVGVPSLGMWNEQFGMSLIGLMLHASQEVEVSLHSRRGSCISESREILAEIALAGEYTHLLFLDSDQTFPVDLLNRLLRHDKSVVACNIATKSEPSQETARLVTGPAEFKTGLEKVWRVGAGIMLVKTKVFSELKQPWFPTGWDPDRKKTIGEDWMFCKALEAAGIPIWVDHNSSATVGHEGLKIYRLGKYLEASRENLSSTRSVGTFPSIIPSAANA